MCRSLVCFQLRSFFYLTQSHVIGFHLLWDTSQPEIILLSKARASIISVYRFNSASFCLFWQQSVRLISLCNRLSRSFLSRSNMSVARSDDTLVRSLLRKVLLRRTYSHPFPPHCLQVNVVLGVLNNGLFHCLWFSFFLCGGWYGGEKQTRYSMLLNTQPMVLVYN